MRFTPASILLATALALTASSGVGKKAPETVAATSGASSPAARQWTDYGAVALAGGNLEGAREAYESALLLTPGDPNVYFALGKIARAQKLPGKAVKYFNDVLRLDPKHQLALQGEGLALMDKGATESARESLAKLKTLCKTNCAVAEPLAAAIAAGPSKLATADATSKVTPPTARN